MKKILLEEENEILKREESFADKTLKILFLTLFVGSYLALVVMTTYGLVLYLFFK
ncbi:hypothetical protein [uncultured Cetobacterium sp.]|uniref:hypothetical protein n=1 Tax=uncultured Cetobacterium sp. TaxID=527638 RepID=UPI0026107324|nr:hypothetical protein [uncultured Cetobacterium sp.]